MTGIDKAVAAEGSQGKLALRLGVTQQAVSKFIAQGYLPLDRAKQIAEWYAIPLRELVKSDIAEIL